MIQTRACNTCDGMGEWDEMLPCSSPVQESPDYAQIICEDCGGTGVVDVDLDEEAGL